MKTLEKHIASLLSEAPGATFDIMAHGLWRDSDGRWSSNDRWSLVHKASLPYTLAILRERWEIFKANYAPRARVKDITDIGEGNYYSLECGHLPFVDITANEPELTTDHPAHVLQN
jgi:hypothetical protein